MKLSTTLAAALLLVSGASHLEAAKLKVPRDYPTIQAAMDAVQNGDVVLISAATYAENVVLQSHSKVTIKGIGKVVIQPVAGTGLVVKTCTKITIQGIRFRKAPLHNLFVEGCDEVEIRKCRVKKGKYGFYVKDCQGVLMEDNEIQDTGTGGITLFSTESSLVRCNHVSGSGQYAIYSTGDCNTIEKNNVDDCYHGIVVEQCTNNLVVGNDIRSISDRGISLAAVSGVTVLDNDVRKAKIGISVGNDSYDTVAENSIRKTGEHGIRIQSSSHTTVFGNKIRKANHNGIHLSADHGLFHKNDVRKSGHDGFSISGNDCAFIENVAQKSGWFDFQENAGSTNMTYIANVFGTSDF